jgi:hypothetical protein
MLGRVFALAMAAPGRQFALQRALVGHALVLLPCALAVDVWGSAEHKFLGQVLLGQVLLVAGITEGAMLVGWRLTQLPKSQALEFLLVTPQRPALVFFAEALVGLARLALVTLSGLPLLMLLVVNGKLWLSDVPVLLIMPYTWGAITGLGFTLWAYEPLFIRRLAERLILAGIIFYLAVGVIAGEHLALWLAWLPKDHFSIKIGEWVDSDVTLEGLILSSFRAFHELNPFGVMQAWMEPHYLRVAPIVAQERMYGLEMGALIVTGMLLARTSSRLKGHFHERHYKPILDPKEKDRGTMGNRPLAWWAVRRVTEYSGRANLWLAGGFGILYAAYTVAGPNWPAWMGRMVFYIFDQHMGGIPVLATSLVVLAAVPAAWQYGLWDSNAQDRCRRLELLLLTELEATDYWEAATAAAWKRGRGYFWVAGLLWLAGAIAGQISLEQLAAALASGTLLWCLYFALGFRAFSQGMQANGLGSLLTLGLPGLTYVLFMAGWPAVGGLLPPGCVYAAVKEPVLPLWIVAPLLIGGLTLVISRTALARCDAELRRWYEMNHGQKVVD